MAAVQNRITHVLLVLLLFSMLAVIGMLGTVVRGGQLDPPGIPGPTDGVRQPGTPISSIPFTISQPGNYYVTRNLTMPAGGNGITIAANDVTLDLGGFALDGADLGATGVLATQAGARGIVVRNGTVLNWGSGVFVAGTTVEHVAAHDNVTGIRVSSGQLIACSAVGNTGAGVTAIFSTVTGCLSSANALGFDIHSGSLRDCTAESNTTGIQVERSVIEGCSVLSSSANGILALDGTVVRNNTVWNSGANGIHLSGPVGSSLVIDNTVFSSGGITAGAGIAVVSSNNRITGNNVTESNVTGIGVSGSSNTVDGNSVSGSVGFGFHIQGAKNTVVRNSAVNNGTPVNNYVIDGGNNPGTVIAANSTGDWSNTQ